VPGVGRVRAGGSNAEAIRVELSRDRLAAYGLTVGDVVTALRQQNVEIPSGRVEGTWREFVVKTEGEFADAEGFRTLIVDYVGGAPVRLGDIAAIRRGFENERTRASYNGIRTSGLGIVKQSQANTLAVATGVKRRLEELRPQLPDGFEMQIAFDQSPFIERSVREVQQALLIAGVLVVIVIFVFLQSVRTTIIPSIVMPVAIMATFGVIYFLGFSINNLVLMALTLVVGVVVDDAIIVLENVYRHMEEGEARVQAARAGSSEIAFAVIATTLTLVAVFVPIAFLGGTTGRFFFEFGISVAVAVSVSSFVALTLTPMLCSRFLSVGSTAGRPGLAGRMARTFDSALDRCSFAYARSLDWAFRHRPIVVTALLSSVVMSGMLFANAGKEFVPQDDRGYFMVSIRTPEGSTFAYQDRYQTEVERLLDETPDVRSYFSIVAISRGGPGKVNSGVMFVRLQPWGRRERTANEIVADLRVRATKVAGADVYFSQFNPLQSGGSSKPLEFVVQHPDFDQLAAYSEKLRAAIAEIPGIADVDSDLEVNKPQLDVAIDRDRAASLGISVVDIADTLKVLLGGDTVTRYKRGNERYDVIAQLEPGQRLRAQDLRDIYARASNEELVPLSNLVVVDETVGPSAVNHYDRKRSVIIDANLQDVPLGDAIERVRTAASDLLPEGFTTNLAGQSRELERSSQGLAFTFILAIVAIYLVLAGQFESFVHPFTIMLALPFATFGALAGLNLFGMTLNVYSYIGIIMLMGLVTKNSILLVDYANQQRDAGLPTRDALMRAGRTRLRPILMTAVSTIFGILPIAIGFGPGAEGRRPLGVAVVAGMVTSTVLTLLVVPVVYSLIDDLALRLAARRERAQAARAAGADASEPRAADRT
jgi:hydrophobe/amphiphile efflux-1 (HAE1) family protein